MTTQTDQSEEVRFAKIAADEAHAQYVSASTEKHMAIARAADAKKAATKAHKAYVRALMMAVEAVEKGPTLSEVQ